MTTPASEPLAESVSIGDDELCVKLADGRALEVPIEWFVKLEDASPEQLSNFEIVEGGRVIRWLELGEEISVAGLLRGIAALGDG